MLSKSIVALVGALSISGLCANSVTAATLGLNFTKLSGLTGGNPSMTAVYRGDLSNLDLDLNSISITDNSSALGGAAGQFTGFDLDGIILSRQRIDDASQIASLSRLDIFDFAGGSLVTPGTQRLPIDTKLFGTTASGTGVDPAVATLHQFDANPLVGPTVGGFVSLGDTGKIGFNLTAPLTPMESLYLYIGEVGDNGEVASGQITVSDQLIDLPPAEPSPPPIAPASPEPAPPTPPIDVSEPEIERIPEPSLALAILILGGVAVHRHRQSKA